MNHWKTFAFATCLGLFGLATTPPANADEWNKKTILTVNEPLQVPGQTLQPGKYVMKLMDSPSNRHIVQIFNGDETHLMTTILAIPNYRLRPTGKTQFTFWETPAGQPAALRAWFYPGDMFGQEFAYKATEATQIAQTTNQSVLTTEANNVTELQNAPVHTTTPQGQSAELDQQAYTAPPSTPQASTPEVTTPEAPAATPAPTPMPEQTQTQMASRTRTRLPRTGGQLPLVAMIGLMAFAAGVTTIVARRRTA